MVVLTSVNDHKEQKLTDRRATIAYVLPFGVFVCFLAAHRILPVPEMALYLLRFAAVLSAILLFSRRAMPWIPSQALASAGIGVLVFVIWVAPDVLWPGYREHWLFSNALTGAPRSSIPAELRANFLFTVMRATSSFLLVPVLEELFWRGWMMRWLIAKQFRSVPIGAYTAESFWIVALLFASEHGPYWEVGLAAGIVYNWWLVRTRNLADCIVAHAVTNFCLSAYVLYSGQWQYWL